MLGPAVGRLQIFLQRSSSVNGAQFAGLAAPGMLRSRKSANSDCCNALALLMCCPALTVATVSRAAISSRTGHMETSSDLLPAWKNARASPEYVGVAALVAPALSHAERMTQSALSRSVEASDAVRIPSSIGVGISGGVSTNAGSPIVEIPPTKP